MLDQLRNLASSVSDRRTLRAVLVIFVICGAVQFALHVLLTKLGVSELVDAAIDAKLIGAFIGLVFWLLLVGVRERQRRVREDLERLAELNHEIRNALQVIGYAQFDVDVNVERRAMVLDSVNRIDVVLKRLFPAFEVTVPTLKGSAYDP